MSGLLVHRAHSAVGRMLIAVMPALALTGCSAIGLNRITAGASPFTDGSGVKTTVQRTIGGYHAIAASSGVTVVVHAGTPGVASVTADDNLLGQIVTEVRDETLYVELQGGVRTADPLRVEVANSGIDAVSASTGATVKAEAVKGSAISVAASTGATVRATGSADLLRVASSTGATADLRNVVAARVEANVSTGGSAHVQPTDSVTGTCTGGGSLLVHGTPAHNDVTTDNSSSVKDGQ